MTSPFESARDAWWRWRMKPGAEACGRWVRITRDMWIGDLKAAKDYAEVADAAVDALDSIYSFMVAHGWMDVDEGALDGPGLPLQPFPVAK